MRRFNAGRKEYRRTAGKQILQFLKDEVRRSPAGALGDYESLSAFDLHLDLSFLIYLDDRPVGFACMRVDRTTADRRLTRIYVTPISRNHGCCKFVLQGLKITDITIPIRNIQLISLCRTLEFQYKKHQPYPDTVVELTRTIKDEHHGISVNVSASKLG